ncbi:MAG: urea ABC transporter permease subunit UrtC [Meiothermus sp.]|nr:urea ABC transporter permease subunit UrtC [Meiothermus sp.]
MTPKRALLLALLLALALAPFYLSGYNLILVGRFLALAVVAIGISLIWGTTGILSLGQGLFFGLGAYALAMHLKLVSTPAGELPDFMVYNGVEALPWWWAPFANPAFALAAVLLLPALAAAALGWLMFRRRITGVYVSLITQALVLAFATLLIGSQGVTSGTNGITDYKTFLGLELRGPGFVNGLYWLTLAVVVGAYVGVKLLLKSHFGKLLVAIRDGENRVRFLGYDPAAYKIAAFAVGGLLAGVSGALFAVHVGTISPAMVGVIPSIEFVVWVALGGRESLGGAVLGIVAGNLIKDRVSSAYPEMWLYVMGLLFVLVVLGMPRGLAGWVKPWLERLSLPRRAAPPARVSGPERGEA